MDFGFAQIGAKWRSDSGFKEKWNEVEGGYFCSFPRRFTRSPDFFLFSIPPLPSFLRSLPAGNLNRGEHGYFSHSQIGRAHV